MFENLVLVRDGAVASVTLNRPQVLNALNARTLDELQRVFLELQTDSDIRAVVVTGAGEKAFAAGAAINGFALGGGCELAMACTLRLAADTARLGQPEINLGITPGFAGTQRLVRLVGKAAALDLLLSGRHVTADEALRIGLVHRVVPVAELHAAAQALAVELAAKAPLATRFILEAVHQGSDVSFEQGEYLESTLFGLAFATRDMREGTRAFLDKRKPVFKGE